MTRRARWARGLVGLLAAASLAGCSVRRLAIRSLGGALASSGGVYASDDDPELVGAALPFALKTIEGLLAQAPDDTRLLEAAASGFTQYAYAFVQTPADFVEDSDPARSRELDVRALKLYRRAFGYGWRGLEVNFPGLRDKLRAQPDQAPAVLAGLKLEARHVPLLFWTAAPTAAAISLAKNDGELAADLSLVEALMRRALELDEGYGGGALHEFFIAYEGGRSSLGGSLEAAGKHFDRAIELAQGRLASPFVTYAENVAVAQQNRAEFERLLQQALAVDPEALPEERLANTIAQRRARWLLGRVDDLFIE